MGNAQPLDDQIRRIGLLDEPVRLALHRYLQSRAPAEVGRDEAAQAVGITRKLAAFHLDRLAAAGLLETSYRRLTGRQGPGAGRPAKLYRLADVEVAISLPPRRYDLTSRIFASALGIRRDTPSSRTIKDAARRLGQSAGSDGRRRARDLRDVLSEQGFEPVAHGTVVRLRNCPFHSLTEEYKLPICEMNLAFQRGVIDGLEYDDTTARLTPEAGYCCVTIESNPAASDKQGSRALPRSRLRSLASAIGGLRPH